MGKSVSINRNGVFEHTNIDIGIELYSEVLQCADLLNLPQLARLGDFYSDTEYREGDLPLLESEIVRATGELEPSTKLSELLRAFLEAVREAKRDGGMLLALAD